MLLSDKANIQATNTYSNSRIEFEENTLDRHRKLNECDANFRI